LVIYLSDKLLVRNMHKKAGVLGIRTVALLLKIQGESLVRRIVSARMRWQRAGGL